MVPAVVMAIGKVNDAVTVVVAPSAVLAEPTEGVTVYELYVYACATLLHRSVVHAISAAISNR